MSTATPAPFSPAPQPFLDSDHIRQLLEGLTSGTTFLVAVLRDKDCPPAAYTGAIALEEMANELAVMLGEKPAVLNQEHPEFATICRNIHAAVKEPA